MCWTEGLGKANGPQGIIEDGLLHDTLSLTLARVAASTEQAAAAAAVARCVEVLELVAGLRPSALLHE